MTKKKSYGGLAILTAIAASLCCITPVLAFIAGLGGMASTFSRLEPFRPYLIGMTVLVLAFAWYQKLKPIKDIDCDCEDEKTPPIQTKTFLGIVTVFAGLMLAFPTYVHIFYPDTEASKIEISQGNLGTEALNISGMTCTGCEEYITHAVNELEGIRSVDVSFETGHATVEFDKTKTDKDEITRAINATGYKVTE
ncbi:MAG: mercuric transport protein MerTP [Flavobacteriales bacterium]|nr:MAG: mercuric transport protein MerTP [Flavobacteriales bacterium]